MSTKPGRFGFCPDAAHAAANTQAPAINPASARVRQPPFPAPRERPGVPDKLGISEVKFLSTIVIGASVVLAATVASTISFDEIAARSGLVFTTLSSPT